jgi:hypothetical protein
MPDVCWVLFARHSGDSIEQVADSYLLRADTLAPFIEKLIALGTTDIVVCLISPVALCPEFSMHETLAVVVYATAFPPS